MGLIGCTIVSDATRNGCLLNYSWRFQPQTVTELLCGSITIGAVLVSGTQEVNVISVRLKVEVGQGHLFCPARAPSLLPTQ